MIDPAPRLCIECQHFEATPLPPGDCVHPLNMKRSLVTGKVIPGTPAEFLRSEHFRSGIKTCGRIASWFEPLGHPA